MIWVLICFGSRVEKDEGRGRRNEGEKAETYGSLDRQKLKNQNLHHVTMETINSDEIF